MTKVIRTRDEVAKILEAFLAGSGGDWDWDDFLSFAIVDEELELIRVHCNRLDSEFPATEKGHFCGPKGFEVISEYVRQLRARP
jgi:hypothetical protein